MEVLPYVDYLFANESEAEAFAQANKWDVSVGFLVVWFLVLVTERLFFVYS